MGYTMNRNSNTFFPFYISPNSLATNLKVYTFCWFVRDLKMLFIKWNFSHSLSVYINYITKHWFWVTFRRRLKDSSLVHTVHTDPFRHRHCNKCNVDGQNGYSTHSAHHSAHQNDQRCHPSMLWRRWRSRSESFWRCVLLRQTQKNVAAVLDILR